MLFLKFLVLSLLINPLSANTNLFYKVHAKSDWEILSVLLALSFRINDTAILKKRSYFSEPNKLTSSKPKTQLLTPHLL